MERYEYKTTVFKLKNFKVISVEVEDNLFWLADCWTIQQAEFILQIIFAEIIKPKWTYFISHSRFRWRCYKFVLLVRQ